MTIITKAGLAAELNVSKSRVSQYLRAGLPERPDGKLDRESSLNWIALNLRSSPDREKGPAKAHKLERAPSHVVGDVEAARRAISGFAGQVTFFVAHTAVDLGISMRVAYALSVEVASALDDVAAEQMQRLGVSNCGSLVSGPKALTPDWLTLADRAGEPVDLGGWEAFRVEAHARLYAAETDDEIDQPAQSRPTTQEIAP